MMFCCVLENLGDSFLWSKYPLSSFVNVPLFIEKEWTCCPSPALQRNDKIIGNMKGTSGGACWQLIRLVSLALLFIQTKFRWKAAFVIKVLSMKRKGMYPLTKDSIIQNTKFKTLV